MSVFVNPNNTFPIKVRYLSIKNEAGEVVNAKIIPDNAEIQENEELLVCECVGRDYENMSKILEETTIINHISGKPMIRTKIFRVEIINKFIIKWNLVNEDGMIPINTENINKMFYSLVKAISNKWLSATAG